MQNLLLEQLLITTVYTTNEIFWKSFQILPERSYLELIISKTNPNFKQENLRREKRS